MDKEITFDLEKFLNEDCKEENEIGVKMTFSILRKAFEKGLQNGTSYSYEKGMKDAKTEFIAMLTELHKEIMEMSTIDICPYAIDNCIDRIEAEILVREKIDKLKGEEDGKNI